MGDKGRGLRGCSEKAWEDFLFSTLNCCPFTCALTIGCVPLHGCFSNNKKTDLTICCNCFIFRPRMGPSDWVEKKGKGEKGAGYEYGSVLPTPSLS